MIGRRLVTQGMAFSTGEHDAILDCLAIAIRLLGELLAWSSSPGFCKRP